MCPVCLATTAAIVVASGTSSGGLAALVFKGVRVKSTTKPVEPPTRQRGAQNNRPTVVCRDEWLVTRKKLLAKEKEASRQRDALSNERRSLPMVKIE